MLVPTLINFFVNKPEIEDVQAGYLFCVVLLKDGSLYAMGNEYCCGQATTMNHFFAPVQVNIGTANPKVESITCCSYASTLVKTVNDQYYAFGNVSEQAKPAFGKEVCHIASRIDESFPQHIKIKKNCRIQVCIFHVGREWRSACHWKRWQWRNGIE